MFRGKIRPDGPVESDYFFAFLAFFVAFLAAFFAVFLAAFFAAFFAVFFTLITSFPPWLESLELQASLAQPRA
ncbi:hypothetical protein HS125_17970 [bacterium]|nr:hypothetical protein [bacterium]